MRNSNALFLEKQVPPEKPRIFISHTWKDKELVRPVEDKLNVLDVDVWVDHNELQGGHIITERVGEALEWCNILLLIWSKAASRSRWVKYEWGACLNLNKIIIPCIMDNTKLPTILGSVASVDLQDIEQGFLKLLNSLGLEEPRKTSVNNSSQK